MIPFTCLVFGGFVDESVALIIARLQGLSVNAAFTFSRTERRLPPSIIAAVSTSVQLVTNHLQAKKALQKKLKKINK